MKTLIKKTTGNVTASSLDAGEALTERTSPFDIILQVIDHEVEIVIDHQTYNMDRVESVIIPVHFRDVLRANMRFKVMCTVIKSLGGTVSIYTV